MIYLEKRTWVILILNDSDNDMDTSFCTTLYLKFDTRLSLLDVESITCSEH